MLNIAHSSYFCLLGMVARGHRRLRHVRVVLKALCDDLSVNIVWYLYPDEGGNGAHVPHPNSPRFKLNSKLLVV